MKVASIAEYATALAISLSCVSRYCIRKGTIITAALQDVSHVAVTDVAKGTLGRPEGFIPDEAVGDDQRSLRTPPSRMAGEVDPRRRH